MNLNDVAKSFAGAKRGHGTERHSIKSLSKRLMLSRQTVRKMLKGGELEFSAQFDTGGNGPSYEFPSARLDAMRESIVEEIINEICARLQGLDLPEHEMVLAALHGCRCQKADVEHEFATKANDDDDDDEHEVAKLIGAGVGGGAGAAIGGRLIGGIAGRITGAAIGSAAGGSIGGTDAAPDIAAAGVGAGIGYGAHKLIPSTGGYRAAAERAAAAGEEILKGRMVTALRRALAKAAAKAI
jgi:hypothetical protein